MFVDRDGDPVLLAVAALRATLAGAGAAAADSVLIDRIRALEECKSVIAAAQAIDTVALVDSQRAAQVALGVPADQIGRGVAAQVGLARRVSPFEAGRYCGQARVLIGELPESFARLMAGEVSEWRVMLLAQQTGWLSRAHRATVDAEVAPKLEQLGTRRIVNLVQTLAYRLDPSGYLARLSQVEAERNVSLRPAPECMTRLSALLPLTQGVAVYAALDAHAKATVGVGGQTRTRGQVMADTLVERITGQRVATAVAVEVNLVMTDQTLLGYGTGSEEPAHVIGGGPIPAALARRAVRDASGDTAVFLRRLFTCPTSGQLAAMDSSARLFTANQHKFLLLRDQTCRTPWCDAPIREADHVIPAADGGSTSVANGQGLCVACNRSKQAPAGIKRSIASTSGQSLPPATRIPVEHPTHQEKV